MRGGLLAAVLVAGCGTWADEPFCADPGCEWSDGQWARLARLANPPAPPPDRSNRFVGARAAEDLGQALFFDTGFSGPSRQRDALGRPTLVGRAPENAETGLSCASCHDLRRGGADATSVPGHVSVGAGVTDVNAQPVVNAAHAPVVFWNGRLDSLWALNVVVGESTTTMNGNRLRTARRMAERYGAEVDAVFGVILPPDWRRRAAALPMNGKPGEVTYDRLDPADRDLATTLLVLWSKAIAAYEHRLVSGNSAFDRFVAEGPSSTSISPRARTGARLFVGKAGCVDCHNGPLLSDWGFHNVGVPQIGALVPTLSDCGAGASCDCVAGSNCLPWGAYHGQGRLRDPENRWVRHLSVHSDAVADQRSPYLDRPLDDRLKGAWRTPSLRDVALTAPYMHDGALATLEDVLWHYNTGGSAAAPFRVGVPSSRLKPLGLDADEIAALIEFLGTLTGAPLPGDLVTPPPVR